MQNFKTQLYFKMRLTVHSHPEKKKRKSYCLPKTKLSENVFQIGRKLKSQAYSFKMQTENSWKSNLLSCGLKGSNSTFLLPVIAAFSNFSGVVPGRGTR